MRYVYVLDTNGKPLMPTCRFGKLRRMLKSGQARAVDTLPFTIQLTYEPTLAWLPSVPTERNWADFTVKHEIRKSRS